MAIGNLLGSSLINVMILAIDDLFYRRGPLLSAADLVHAATALTAMVMSGLVIIGLVMRPQGRVLRVTSWISIALLSTYLVNVALIYLSGPSAAGLGSVNKSVAPSATRTKLMKPWNMRSSTLKREKMRW
ncbi:MAG TPA: hypothetical protein VIW70_01665 [Rubrivivax sp.]